MSVEQGAGSGDLAQGSGSPVGVSLLCTRYSPPVTRHSARRAGRAFTLIELLVVIAIVAILAGLTLSTLGYVNKKGAQSRAQAEIAALSAAIESFKLDNGFYPSNAAALFTNLCPTAANAKVYFEPTPRMVANNRFIDPWGSDYLYANSTNYFELWSTAGNANDTNGYIRN